MLCLLGGIDSERWNLSGWDVRLFLSSLMVILPFLAFYIFKSYCDHDFCGTFVCLSCCDLFGEETLRD